MFSLEASVRMTFLLSDKEVAGLTGAVDYKVLSTWAEQLVAKVFYGEFRFTPASTVDMLRLFSGLYHWLSAGEMTGRFVFDLGQSLYEGGRPVIGQMMMKRGFETCDPLLEGEVSTSIVTMRLALDYPLVPQSSLEILQSYLNMTSHLSESLYTPMQADNLVDLYWPLPLLAWSALPVMPIFTELLWRFEEEPLPPLPPLRGSDGLNTSMDLIYDQFHTDEWKVAVAEAAEAEAREVGRHRDYDLTEFVGSFHSLSSGGSKGVKRVVVPPSTGGGGVGGGRGGRDG
ncbi:hypothetical protein B484DRAFT_391495, partial [Ochromonadaceae sp. CCMP2298]